MNVVNYGPVIIVAGNHDLLENNRDRLDSLTPIIEIMNNPYVSYFTESKCYEDDNIVCVFILSLMVILDHPLRKLEKNMVRIRNT